MKSFFHPSSEKVGQKSEGREGLVLLLLGFHRTSLQRAMVE